MTKIILGLIAHATCSSTNAKSDPVLVPVVTPSNGQQPSIEKNIFETLSVNGNSPSKFDSEPVLVNISKPNIVVTEGTSS